MTAADRLRSLVKGSRVEAQAVDAEKAVALWRERVDRLFRDVASWLSWISEADGSMQRVGLQNREELLGSYEIEGLSVTLQGREFFFEPRGTHIIGADGRVDLYEVGRVEHLVLLIYFAGDGHKPGQWELRAPTDRFTGIPLNSETLQEVLLRWMRD